MSEGPIEGLYWEKQDAALCGVHAINALLQGPYFTEIDLMTIAHDLDRKEKEMMREGGETSVEFLKFLAEDSANVAEDGNFSVQVLEKALEVWNLTLVPLASPEMKEIRADPTLGQAYICNLMEHWFTVRLIGSQWWNLNSIFDSPQLLSPSYLAMFFEQIKAEGYTIFVARGGLPQCVGDTMPIFHLPANESPFFGKGGVVEKKGGKGKRKDRSGSAGGGGGGFDDDLERAIAASLKDAAPPSSSSSSSAAAAATGTVSFSGTGYSLNSNNNNNNKIGNIDTTALAANLKLALSKANNNNNNNNRVEESVHFDDEDEELKAALLLSQQESQQISNSSSSSSSAAAGNESGSLEMPPDVEGESCEIKFVFPNGPTLVKKLAKTDKMAKLYQCILASRQLQATIFDGFFGFPPKILNFPLPPSLAEQSLEEGGVYPQALIRLKEK